MDQDTLYSLIANVLGASTGTFLYTYYSNHIKPIQSIASDSGISYFHLDKAKAKTLYAYLSDWSAVIPDPSKEFYPEKIKEGLPFEVKIAWDEHINNKNISVSASADEPLRSWQTIFQNSNIRKQRVKEFYKEPVVRAYLTKQREIAEPTPYAKNI